MIITVSYPEKGECADPVNEDAILGKEGGESPGRSKERQFSFGHRRWQDVNLSEMRRRQRDKKDDPFTAQRHQHAQSKSTCIAGKLATDSL